MNVSDEAYWVSVQKLGLSTIGYGDDGAKWRICRDGIEPWDDDADYAMFVRQASDWLFGRTLK